MNFVAGNPINRRVGKLINAKQAIFEASQGSDRNLYIEYQGLVPWARLSSSVKIKSGTKTATRFGTSGYQLAKDNILFTLFNDEEEALPGYENTQLGYRPKPGITNVAVHSHNRFGSLRTAAISFQCWSREQLDVLELLYMRPGYTLFLEWGWTGYLNQSEDSEEYFIDTVVNPLDFTSYSTREKAINAIIQKKENYRYHYDGIAGFVKNFSWSLRPDGGYDCTSYIVTAGDVIESLKVNFFISQKYITDRAAQLESEITKAARQAVPEGTRTVTVDGEEFEVPNVDYEARRELQIEFPSTRTLRYADIPFDKPDFENTADPTAAAQLETIYNEFKKRVKDTLGTRPLQKKSNLGGAFLINPVTREFSFAGGYAAKIRENVVDNSRQINKRAEAFIKENPELEIVELAKNAGQYVVLRYK